MTEARQALAEALRRIKALTAGSGGNARHFPSNTCYLVNEIASKALLASLPPVNTDQNGGSDIGEGNHDCLAKRRPDEPMFILLGRDPDAHNIVRSWAERRLAAGGDPEHCQMGLDTAERMQAYAADPVNAPASAPPASSYPPLAATPQPAEPGALREEVARIIHEHQGNGDPDELIHHPAAKSWDEPTEPRWSQWLEIADAILNLTQADARRIAELERQIGSWRSQCMDEEERRNTAEARAEALSAEVERLNERNVELAMLSHQWMVAHDKLRAGEPYDFPRPADVPDSIAEAERLRAGLRACQERFKEYAASHALKGTADGDHKAERNVAMVEMCRRLLTEAQPTKEGE